MEQTEDTIEIVHLRLRVHQLEEELAETKVKLLSTETTLSELERKYANSEAVCNELRNQVANLAAEMEKTKNILSNEKHINGSTDMICVKETGGQESVTADSLSLVVGQC